MDGEEYEMFTDDCALTGMIVTPFYCLGAWPRKYSCCKLALAEIRFAGSYTSMRCQSKSQPGSMNGSQRNLQRADLR